MEKTTPSQAVTKLERQRKSEDKRLVKLTADPTCSKCKVTKTLDDFPAKGVDYWCRECRKNAAIAGYHRRRSVLNDGELAELKGKINKRQNARRAKAIAQMPPEMLAAYRARENKRNIEKRQKVKDTAFAAYGGYVCSCCGETQKMFLTVDHMNNDGAQHRREHKLTTGTKFYTWLIRNGYPDGFQILCMNCNWGKRMNNGVCPHVTEGVTTIPKGSRAKRLEAQRTP